LSAPLQFTGERFTPECNGAIWYEHWHRYCAVLPAAESRRVLDAACGEGYGSMLLAGVAASVVGIDIDPVAIGHAAARYAHRANLGFIHGSCAAVPLSDASIDLIVSFETIEHLCEQEAMLAEFRRVLAPDGALIISSPNKATYSQETGDANHFHVRELTREELAALLARAFPQQTWYGQRALAHSLIWAEEVKDDFPAELIALRQGGVEPLAAPAPPVYFIVVCGDEGVVLPRLSALSLFDDGAQSLYRDYERALLAEKRLYWDEIDARKIAQERLEEAIKAVNELASAKQREDALRQFAAELRNELERTQSAHAEVARALAEAQSRLRFRESWRGWARWPVHRLRGSIVGASDS
jgi:ubiquinone/menaquinone biosynthesis C-methylase UbiE